MIHKTNGWVILHCKTNLLNYQILDTNRTHQPRNKNSRDRVRITAYAFSCAPLVTQAGSRTRTISAVRTVKSMGLHT